MGDGAASTGWGPERIRNHLAQGHPVIVLTRLGYLPGYNTSSTVDHYIILIGANDSSYVYNDPALGNGAKRIISGKQLQLAQRAAVAPGQGAAFSGPPNETPASQAPDPNAPITHVTVMAGDTLSELAQRYGVDLTQILELNRSSVRNINHIEVGQVLAIPGVAPAEPEEAAAQSAPTPSPTPTASPTPSPTASPTPLKKAALRSPG